MTPIIKGPLSSMPSQLFRDPKHKTQSRTQKVQGGLTLIEILIAMTIMGFLTLIVSTSIRSALKNRIKIENRIENQGRLYETLYVMKRDMERAFHYQDVFFLMKENLRIQFPTWGNNSPSSPNPPFLNSSPPPLRTTQFLGESDQLHFTTLNHFRTLYNSPQSNQIEVGFEMKDCQVEGGKKVPCLWRRMDLLIDSQVEDGGNRMVLAPYVEELKFFYRGSGEDEEWVSQWRTDNRGTPQQQNRFPHLVKVELQIHPPQSPVLRQEMVVRILFPNNRPLLTLLSPQGSFQPRGSTRPGTSSQGIQGLIPPGGRADPNQFPERLRKTPPGYPNSPLRGF